MKSLGGIALLALAAMPFTYGQGNSSLDIVLAQMPTCALNCIGEILPKSPCLPTNQTCICENQVFQLDVQTCVTSNCTIKEALTTMNLTAVGCGMPIRDRSHEYIHISNAFGIISAFFVFQRFAYKFYAQMPVCLDDWVTLLTILSGVPSTIINAHFVSHNGVGRDIWTLSSSDITKFTLWFFILEVVYFAQIAMVKLSLLTFYVRIFPTKWAKRLLWGTIVVAILLGLTFVIVAIFQCQPISYYWTKWDGEHKGQCLNINAIAWSNAGIGIIMDIWMLAIPLWQLRDLNLDWRRKIGVALMFCVGSFVTVVSILRLKSLVKFGTDSTNPTWDFFETGVWSDVEINVGLICVCMPSLRLVLVRLFPKLLGSTQRYYAKYSSNPQQSNPGARGPSHGLGNTTSSRVSHSTQPPVEVEPNRIVYHKTYTVEYGDTDEMQLVSMKDVDMKSAKSTVSSL